MSELACVRACVRVWAGCLNASHQTHIPSIVDINAGQGYEAKAPSDGKIVCLARGGS